MKLTKSLLKNLEWCAETEIRAGDGKRTKLMALTISVSTKEAQAILVILTDYKALLQSMMRRDSNLDPVFMEQYATHKLEDLHYVPPTIPRHLTREGGLLGATEEYLREKNNA